MRQCRCTLRARARGSISVVPRRSVVDSGTRCSGSEVDVPVVPRKSAVDSWTSCGVSRVDIQAGGEGYNVRTLFLMVDFLINVLCGTKLFINGLRRCKGIIEVIGELK